MELIACNGHALFLLTLYIKKDMKNEIVLSSGYNFDSLGYRAFRIFLLWSHDFAELRRRRHANIFLSYMNNNWQVTPNVVFSANHLCEALTYLSEHLLASCGHPTSSYIDMARNIRDRLDFYRSRYRFQCGMLRENTLLTDALTLISEPEPKIVSLNWRDLFRENRHF